MARREPVLLARDCQGVEIPSGERITLRRDAFVVPQQVLDGNITVLTERGGLVRLAASDADALGEEYVELAAKAARARAGRTAGPFDESKVWDELRTVYDPEIPASIVDLGLVYQVASEPTDAGARVLVAMTLTAPGCGVGDILVEEVRSKVAGLPGVAEVDVQLIFDPPWNEGMMSDAARLALGIM